MGNMAKWTPERRHLLCRKIAHWLVKRNSPLTLVERDTELRDVFLKLSGGRFDGCSHHEIQKHLLQMVAVGTNNLKQQISDLVHDGLQLALAADLWSDGTDCALLVFSCIGLTKSGLCMKKWQDVYRFMVCATLVRTYAKKQRH